MKALHSGWKHIDPVLLRHVCSFQFLLRWLRLECSQYNNYVDLPCDLNFNISFLCLEQHDLCLVQY